MTSNNDPKTPNVKGDPTQIQSPAQNQAPAASPVQPPAPSTPTTAQQRQPKFKRVLKQFDTRSGARTKSSFVMVESTGYVDASVRTTRLADTLAVDLGLDPQRYYVAFEADPEMKIVGAFLCTATEPGAMPVRRSKDGKTISFHLGGVFQENPDLRPAGKTNCGVERTTDEYGRPYLQISLGSGLGHRKRNHSGSTKASGTPHEHEDEFEDDD